jgi:hypothetical protein
VHEPGTYAAVLQRAPSEDSSAIEQPQQQKRKRLKRGTSNDVNAAKQEAFVQHAAGTGLHSSSMQQLVNGHAQSPPTVGCWTGAGRTWQWREKFAGTSSPAPCRMVDVAVLQQPSSCAGVTRSQYRKDMISSLEFSTDGQLLAAAGVSKQVGSWYAVHASDVLCTVCIGYC